MHHPIRVLFVCDGNAERSQMAEALLRSAGGSTFDVHSAGIDPAPVHPLAIAVIREIGIDMASARSKHLNDYIDTQFDYVITLCEQAQKNCLDFPRDGHALYWQCGDPAAVEGSDAHKLEAFRVVRDAIGARGAAWIKEVRG